MDSFRKLRVPVMILMGIAMGAPLLAAGIQGLRAIMA